MESAKRETVLKSLIKVLPLKNEQPNPSLPEYFSFAKTSCIVCNLEGLKMNLHNSGRAVQRATLYKTDGAVDCYFVIKECWGCGASHYPSYVEWQEDAVKKRKFFTDGGKYFGVTSDTFFTQAFLKEVTEKLFALQATFIAIVESYNETAITKTNDLYHKQ